MMKKNKPGSALSVADGIKQPPSVNPELKKIRRKELSVEAYIEGILNHERSILSRAITIIESNLPGHSVIARKIIEGCLPHTGKSLRIGITGVPGVGKSSFIETFGTYVIGQGHKIAVLAIDPSSKRSKGSILGDKTRMENLSSAKEVYIRPSSSSGSLGGVARKTRETIYLCEAAGYDVIFVETVGVGQSEVAVHSMVDFFLLLMLAGAGDELQGIKKGIMEMADMLVITKSDGLNITAAGRAASEYSSALHMFPPPESGWMPGVLTCSSYANTGMKEIWDRVLDYRNFTFSNGYFETRRKQQALYWMEETIQEGLHSNFYNNEDVHSILKKLKRDVLKSRVSPFDAALKILDAYFKNNNFEQKNTDL